MGANYISSFLYVGGFSAYIHKIIYNCYNNNVVANAGQPISQIGNGEQQPGFDQLYRPRCHIYHCLTFIYHPL